MKWCRARSEGEGELSAAKGGSDEGLDGEVPMLLVDADHDMSDACADSGAGQNI